MKWFGTPWNAPITRPGNGCYKVPTPQGKVCWLCEEPIRAADNGVCMPSETLYGEGVCYVHLRCFRVYIGPAAKP